MGTSCSGGARVTQFIAGNCCSFSFSSSSSPLSAIWCSHKMWGVGHQHRTLPGDRDRSKPPAQREGSPNPPGVGSEGAQPSPCPARLSLGSPVLAELALQCPGQVATKAGLFLPGRAALQSPGNVGSSRDPSKGLFLGTLRWAGLSAPQHHIGSAGQVSAWWSHVLCPCHCTNPPSHCRLCPWGCSDAPQGVVAVIWGRSGDTEAGTEPNLRTAPLPSFSLGVFTPLSSQSAAHGGFFAVRFSRIHVWRRCPSTECPSMGSQ